MKAIMVMFDSLNRHMLQPYGCDWVKTPNFERLAKRSVTFDCNYVGSMPCMPARRELHTGRINFLHRGWSPLEPFDDSMPEILKNNGIYSHLVSDHQHYWEDGGATYHNRYSSWECTRGQEGDTWRVLPELIEASHRKGGIPLMEKMKKHDKVNRQFIQCEEEMPQAVTFRQGLAFMRDNHKADDWFLQIETFDPHEPFFTMDEYKKLYPHEYHGEMKDWPPYYFVTEGEESVKHMRFEYAALVTMCDRYLGKVLDAMDEYGLWEDTMLIVNTDHGYLLGEHGWWSKTVMPLYEEIARTPLFVWDPRYGISGQRRDRLTQSIDIAPTLLEFFGLPIPDDMEGKPLSKVIAENKKIRDYAIYGFHEGHINITDGRFVYMMAPDSSQPLYEYTLQPSHMRAMFSPKELQDIGLAEPFDFTKGCRTMKIMAAPGMTDAANYGSRLYDLSADPAQEVVLKDDETECRLANEARRLMLANDCPEERWIRFGLSKDREISSEEIRAFRSKVIEERIPEQLKDKEWSLEAQNMYHAFQRFLSKENEKTAIDYLRSIITDEKVGMTQILQMVETITPDAEKDMVRYFVMLNSRTQ